MKTGRTGRTGDFHTLPHSSHALTTRRLAQQSSPGGSVRTYGRDGTAQYRRVEG